MSIKISGGGGEGAALTFNSTVGNESGTVAQGDAALFFTDLLKSDVKIEIDQAYLLSADGTPAPSGVDLVIATFDNSGGATKQKTVLSGDGSTIYDDVSAGTVASYSNDTSSPTTIGVLVDNGHFGSGSGSSEEIAAGFIGEVNQSSNLTDPKIETVSVGSITQSGVTVTGDITDIDGYSRLRALAEYKKPSENLFKGSDNQPLRATEGQYTINITGLESGTDYETRAAGNFGLEQVVRGRTLSFTTLAGTIDDFEDGDISEYGGDTGAFTISTNQVFEGTYSLFSNSNNDQNNNFQMYSNSGLDNYPERGDSFSVRVYLTTDGFDYMIRWARANGDVYSLGWRGDNWAGDENDFELAYGDETSVSGDTVLDEVTSANLPTDEWLEYRVFFNDTIECEVYDAAGNQQLTLSASHTSGNDSGGVGYYVNQSPDGSGYVDDWKLI